MFENPKTNNFFIKYDVTKQKFWNFGNRYIIIHIYMHTLYKHPIQQYEYSLSIEKSGTNLRSGFNSTLNITFPGNLIP
jgi:hypothetical protein